LSLDPSDKTLMKKITIELLSDNVQTNDETMRRFYFFNNKDLKKTIKTIKNAHLFFDNF